jgi:hypothetical protein
MQMVFFDSRKDLACMPSPFFSQSVQVGRRRRPWRHSFFFSLKFFTRCLVKILSDILKIFHWLKMWGLWPGERMEYQRQQLWAAYAATAPPSPSSWLKQMGLPTTPSLRVKNSPGQQATIKRHALKGLDKIIVKKNRTPLSYHQAVRPPVARPLSPPGKFSIPANF